LTARIVVSISLLLLPGPAWPQEAAGGLKLKPISGEGAHNNIRKQSATPPAVEVRDENDKPVQGAQVTFQLPPMGASGAFFGWLRSYSHTTDAEGRAEAASFTPNEEEGSLNILVTAKLGSRSGTVVVHQTNTRDGRAAAGSGSSHKTFWIVVGVAVAAAIGGGIAATRGGGAASGPTTTSVSITPGPVTVGGPR
jgi:hypothetical protein